MKLFDWLNIFMVVVAIQMSAWVLSPKFNL